MWGSDVTRGLAAKRASRWVLDHMDVVLENGVGIKGDVPAGFGSLQAKLRFESLPLTVDQADQVDGHVAVVGRQCRQIVEGLLGLCVEDAVCAKGIKPLLLSLGQWRLQGHETEGS